MIVIEKFNTFGWESAVRGMRNPMNSWDKSDSDFCKYEDELYGWVYFADPIIGNNDMSLMLKLISGGTEHRKFLRMVNVTVDITAPLYWWKEFDTYKVGTVADSCSTMHKIAAKEFVLDDFSVEHLFNGCDKCENPTDDMEYYENSTTCLEYVISVLNYYRKKYIETKDKKNWWQMIQLLPSSYNQRRTIQLNYEVLMAQHWQRKNHKLDEWREYCKWIESLPYMRDLLAAVEKENVNG